MLDLEEKRARLEEKQIELDATLRRDERDFQFKMISMMMRNVNSVPPSAQCILAIHINISLMHKGPVLMDMTIIIVLIQMPPKKVYDVYSVATVLHFIVYIYNSVIFVLIYVLLYV